MSRRYKSLTMRFDLPLATAESPRVFRCYASHGKGYGGCPPWGTAIRILAVNAARETRWEDGWYGKTDPHYHCTPLRGTDDWKRLGWMMADGSLPLGELDAVDPELAQYQYLPAVDTTDTPRTPVIAPFSRT